MQRGGSIYILTNRRNGVLYIGVTSDLIARVAQHRSREHGGSFTARYRLELLVYYEHFAFIEEAIAREKQLKAGKRSSKIALIEAMNPTWKDLYEELLEP